MTNNKKDLSTNSKRWLSHPRLPVLLALLGTILALPSLWAGLQMDDYLHRLVLLKSPLADQFLSPPPAMFGSADGDPVKIRNLMDLGYTSPWWTLETIRFRFYRPLAVLFYKLDYHLWPNNIVLMHCQSLLWYALVVVLVTCLYRRIMAGGWLAGLAALLYTIDDAHAMSAAWLADRAALMSLFWGISVLLLHDRWRRNGSHTAAWCSPLFLLAGILSHEGTIACGAYLFAYALFLDHGKWYERALSLAPCGMVIVLWRIAYNTLGYGIWGSELYIDPLYSPWHFLSVLWRRFATLFLGQWAMPPSDLYILLQPGLQSLFWASGIILLLWFFSVLLPVLRRDRIACFWATGMLVSIVPVCATFPMDRLLLFAGVGAMGLLAQFLGAMGTDRRSVCPTNARRAAALPLYYGFIIMHLVAAPLLFPLRIIGFSYFGDQAAQRIKNIPLNESLLDEKTVVVVDAPSPLVATYLPIYRAVDGKPLPAHIRSLTPNKLFPSGPTTLTRTDRHTLVVEPEGGYPFILLRDRDHLLNAGDEVNLQGMKVTVLSLTPGNFPLKVAYRFDAPLEDPALVWLQFQNNEWKTFTPPSLGESITFN